MQTWARPSPRPWPRRPRWACDRETGARPGARNSRRGRASHPPGEANRASAQKVTPIVPQLRKVLPTVAQPQEDLGGPAPPPPLAPVGVRSRDRRASRPCTFNQFPRSTRQNVTPYLAQPKADLGGPGSPFPPPLALEGVTHVCGCSYKYFPRSTSQGVTPTVAQPHADLGAPLPPPLAPVGVLPPEGVRSSPPPLAPVGVRSRDRRASQRAEPARGEGA